MFKCFKDIPETLLFVIFVSYVRRGMSCNYLAEKVVQWFNETSGKLDAVFSFRFRGKESAAFLKNFPELIKLILNNVTSQSSTLILHRTHFQFIHLRIIISKSVRVKEFSYDQLKEMENSCASLFRSRCLSEDKVSPSFWALCNAAPYHAKTTLSDYNLGLGVNSMEGREQKHQSIEKYSKNTTYQNR